MTFSDLFKVTMIQRQITRKWYNIQLYLQIWIRLCFLDLEDMQRLTEWV